MRRFAIAATLLVLSCLCCCSCCGEADVEPERHGEVRFD